MSAVADRHLPWHRRPAGGITPAARRWNHIIGGPPVPRTASGLAVLTDRFDRDLQECLPMDYRVEMTRAEFDAIPVDPEYPIDELWGPLVDANPRINYEMPMNILTGGQQVLQALGAFDCQVCNGGITQFFWNCPKLIPHVEEALRELNETELHALFTRAVETVIGKQADWGKLREEAYRNPKAPDWEPFRQSYDLLDLGWFENAYFDRRDYNERKEWVVVAEGLQSPFLRRLAAWVKAHPEEFITG